MTRFFRFFTGFIDEGKSQACYLRYYVFRNVVEVQTKFRAEFGFNNVRISRRFPWSSDLSGTKRLGPLLGIGTLLNSNSARNFFCTSTALRNTSYQIANMALFITEKSNEKDDKLAENQVNFQTVSKKFRSHAHKLL